MRLAGCNVSVSKQDLLLPEKGRKSCRFYFGVQFSANFLHRKMARIPTRKTPPPFHIRQAEKLPRCPSKRSPDILRISPVWPPFRAVIALPARPLNMQSWEQETPPRGWEPLVLVDGFDSRVFRLRSFDFRSFHTTNENAGILIIYRML